MRAFKRRTLTALLALLTAATVARAEDPANAGRVLARVNGQPITEGDVQLLLVARGVPENRQPQARTIFLDELIERQLIREFLARRKLKPDQEQVEEQVARIEAAIRKAGDEPDRVLAHIGYDRERLGHELALPLMWRSYVRAIVTPQRVREYFEQHRHELDGTRVRTSQIFLKVSPDAAPEQVQPLEQKLRQLRDEIAAGRTSFAEAARRHSEAPSSAQGGDNGFSTWGGSLPRPLAEVAFMLKAGEVSDPVRTRFGMHLLTVTERKPGDLSLEDVREQILDRLAESIWHETVELERAQAKIERP